MGRYFRDRDTGRFASLEAWESDHGRDGRYVRGFSHPREAEPEKEPEPGPGGGVGEPPREPGEDYIEPPDAFDLDEDEY